MKKEIDGIKLETLNKLIQQATEDLEKERKNLRDIEDKRKQYRKKTAS